MKKLFSLLVLGVIFASLALGDTTEQEELDFLLFLPNSGASFEYKEEAAVHLDRLARYLKDRNILPAQIIVSGYAAVAENDIDPVALSRERAVFVIAELQKRGLSNELFAPPEAYGAVDLWGSNATEDDRRPNRRVRVILDGTPQEYITPEVINAHAESAESETGAAPDAVPDTGAASGDESPRFKFPWIIILLLVLAAIIAALLAARRKSRPPLAERETSETSAGHAAADEASFPAPPEAGEPPAPAAASGGISQGRHLVNLEEEIRLRAYELYEQRNREDGFHAEDWFDALRQVSEKYIAAAYSVYHKDGQWWASR